MLAVTILGNNSAIPAYGRHPTAQIITTADDLLLFDCGEGTQIQILRFKIRRSRINHIFISHLHGDHYFGLIGLLNSFALLGRIQPLHVYGPPPLQQVIELQFRLSETRLPFELHFHPIEGEGVLLDTRHYTVSCFATKHRIPCHGFLVREKRKPRKLIREAVAAHRVPTELLTDLQMGSDYTTPDGTVIPNHLLTTAHPPAKAYAFAADTIFDTRLADVVQGVDLLYHETTYPHSLAQKAEERFHSTSKQAASIALAANAKKLLIGHFSAKFEDLSNFETEAREVFPNTELAQEGVTYLI